MTWKETYEKWNNFEGLDPTMKADLDALKGDEATLEDAFFAPLSFGTAGMRGVLGAGINRMNLYTVRQATEGLAQLHEKYGDEAKKRGCVIAYDSRHQSPEFAMEAARTLGKHGIKAYVFESLRPTPELSFAVRELGTFTGIMITASHNPPEYNGYKVYGEDGGQMPPEDADALTDFIRAIENPLTIEVGNEDELKAQGLIEIIGEEIDAKYLENVETVTIDHDLIAEMAETVSLVYTPLHGVGQMLAERALATAGFKNITYVDEQKDPDPDFTTIKSPNPEEPGAFEVAKVYGEKVNADVLVATDPDADRLGAAVLMPNGEYQVITGNQIGALLTNYILTAKKNAGELPDNGVIVKSIVSSEFPVKIANSFGVKGIDVLTGFKFIAEKIKQYETDGSQTFLFGFEESYGFLVKPFARDKDAIQALVLLAEVAAFYKKQGKTMYDGLQELFETYGTFKEKTISVSLPGIEGAEKIKSLMANFREEGIKEFAGTAVTVTEDFQTSKKTLADGTVEDIDMTSSNVLKYHLEDGSWIAIRPSGTEPKIKFYIATVADSEDAAETKLADFEAAIKQLIN